MFDAEGNLIEGHEVAAALAAAGFVPGGAWKAAEARAGRDVFIWSAEAPGSTRVQHPVLVNRTVADLAEIDQRMARISEVLGVTIGPGGHARDLPGDPAPESA